VFGTLRSGRAKNVPSQGTPLMGVCVLISESKNHVRTSGPLTCRWARS
jgi:hypothetical protein